ncbi:uncharacterized protein LOC129750675 [Uranotaenia lowii]|uniref:uncharacterized protein LOC129750675 n=1 Tax=Uranotaenia lowii TaxID=190385 RepID=UPI00247901C5|nr:uncharacterized protein LOC129750675 [Uranotaenia lowii]
MEKIRKNTIKIAFGASAKPPLYLDIFKFVGNTLAIQASSVHSLYKDENERCCYIKFIDETVFNSFTCKMAAEYPFSYDDGTMITVRLNVASKIFRYIRVFNLPPEIDDKEIAAVLGQFGTIEEQVRERFATNSSFPVFNGIRGVLMEVDKEIPANIFIANFKVRIFYEGMRNRCFLCKNEGHLKAECPKLASYKIGNMESNAPRIEPISFSQVLKNETVGATRNTRSSTTNMTTLSIKSKNRLPHESPKQLTSNVAAKNAPVAVKIPSVEVITIAENDDEDEQSDGVVGDNDDEDENDDSRNDDDGSDDDENDDDAEMNSEKVILKRTISSPSTASEKENKKKKKPQSNATPVALPEPSVPETSLKDTNGPGRRTREKAMKMQKKIQF